MKARDGVEINPLLIQVVKLHRDRARELFRERGLSRGQPPVLYALREKDGQTQADLSRQLFIRPATLTDTLNRMEEADLVERRRDADDQRVMRIHLTDHGRERHGEAVRAMHILEEETFEGFLLEEKLLFRRLLLQMRDNLQSRSR